MEIALAVNHSPGCWPEWQNPLFPSCKADAVQRDCVGFTSAPHRITILL